MVECVKHFELYHSTNAMNRTNDQALVILNKNKTLMLLRKQWENCLLGKSTFAGFWKCDRFKEQLWSIRMICSGSERPLS